MRLFKPKHRIGNCLVFLLISTLSAEQNRDRVIHVEEILVQMESQRLDDWKFDAVESNQGTTYRMTYHPIKNGEGEIELHDINGRKPTEKEKEDFYKDHPPRKPREVEKTGVELSEIVTPGTLTFQTSVEGVSTYTFTPQFKFADEISSEYPLEGILLLREEAGYISDFYVHTKNPFNPKVGMKVINFDLHLQFSKHETDTVLPKKVHTSFEGKAFFFVTIKQEIELSYFNYQKAAQKPD